MLVYLGLYFIVINLEPAMTEYMASIGIMLGIISWVICYKKYKTAVRAGDHQIRKEYKRVVVWMIVYIAAVVGIYFAYFRR